MMFIMSAFKRQLLAACLCSLSAFIIGVWLTWASIALAMFAKGNVVSFAVSNEDQAWIVALIDLGTVVTPVPSGYIMDVFGRKNSILTTSAVFFICGLLSLFAQSPHWYMLARLLAGMCKGLAFTVAPMYIAEVVDKDVRGRMVAIFTGLLKLGFLISLCIGPYMHFFTYNLVLTVIPFFFFISFVFIPESPYYYIRKNGNREAARKSLKWFQGGLENVDDKLDEIVKMVHEDMQNKSGYKELVTSNRRALSIVLATGFLCRMSGISTILGYSSTTLPQHSGFFQAHECLIVFCVLLTVTNFASSPLLDTAGRRTMNIVSAALCSLDMVGLAASYMWHANYWVSYLFTMLFGITYCLGINVVPITLTSELFPANVKSSAAALATMAMGSSSFLSTKFFRAVQMKWGVHWMYLFFSCCSAVHVLFTWFFVFETKGKSFQEIQDILKKPGARPAEPP